MLYLKSVKDKNCIYSLAYHGVNRISRKNCCNKSNGEQEYASGGLSSLGIDLKVGARDAVLREFPDTYENVCNDKIRKDHCSIWIAKVREPFVVRVLVDPGKKRV